MIQAPRGKFVLNGTVLPIVSFRVKLGAFGSVGSFSVTSSRKLLAQNNLDLYQILASAPGVTSGGAASPSVPAQIFGSIDGGTTYTKLLEGDVDSVDYDFDNDAVTILGRDLGGRLVDASVVLKSSQYTNKTPLQIAQSFAADAGLTFVGPPTSPAESTLGYKYLQDFALKSISPIPKWSLLVQLARNVGYQVYTTPKAELVFAPPDQTLQPLVYTWFANPSNATLTPLKELKILYNPRRNRTFQVIMLSYHPKTTELVQSNVVILGQSIPVFKNKTAKEGFWHGSAGASIRQAAGQKLQGKPVYMFYAQGLTPEECQEKADGVAKEISQRQFTMQGTVVGDLRLKPNIPIKLDGPLGEFKGINLMVSGVTYNYSLKRGLTAGITAMYIPPEPQALSVDPFG
jgi:hypothetical protein